MGNSNLLFESVFNKTLSSAETLAYLNQITEEHPYFTPAQFFLLKLIPEESLEYEQQVAKTSLLFNNPYWLQFQLQEINTGTNEIDQTNDPATNKFSLSENEENLPPVNIELEPVKEEVIPGTKIISEGTTIPVEPAIPLAQYEADINKTIDNAPLIPNDEPEIIAPPPVESKAAPGEIIATVLEEPGVESIQHEQGQIIDENPEVSADEFTGLNSTEGTGTTLNTGTPQVEETHTEEAPEPGMHREFLNEGSPLVNEAEPTEENNTIEDAEPLHFKLNIDTTDVKEDTITFEPLHTTDYFASLGIKLSAEIQPNDKLGKQLKSFTEWLKTMKKVHGDQGNAAPVGQTDLSIQKLAEQSNMEEGVITEAMADVLLQQGKTGKAIEVYKKLSLLNPSKSAYFAAKIDQLKEH